LVILDQPIFLPEYGVLARVLLRLADNYVGAPMLSALLGVYAARLGERERALELFERGYADFVIDPSR